jgi:hypothetical protein
VTCWLPGNVQAAVHEVTALPRLVIETLAEKPTFHWLVIEYVAWHPVAATAEDEATATNAPDAANALPQATAMRRARLECQGCLV